MAEVSGGRVRLAAVRATPLSVDEVLDAVRDPAAGGTVVFIGSVRAVDDGRSVTRLGYTAHPGAEATLRTVAESVAQRFPAVALAAVHRVGDLAVGDLAVVVAVACPHRGEAFAAARALIDELKTTVPIWKEQVFGDGTTEWVGTP
ncbi:MAG: molybdopterin synthase catalytic subunit [Frankiaceae bacterium]|jgi:molybdopterin synthase catalytic subunit|nr:molybdopterin synthase catalytic subunit [Frankiaceae bacterium]